MHNAVLEVLVEKGKYQKFPPTTTGFALSQGDDPNAMEYRVEDPDIIHVKCLHIINEKFVHVH